eukprot:1161251-Pelagomonas_calceolata.AAC.6
MRHQGPKPGNRGKVDFLQKEGTPRQNKSYQYIPCEPIAPAQGVDPRTPLKLPEGPHMQQRPHLEGSNSRRRRSRSRVTSPAAPKRRYSCGALGVAWRR